MCNYRNCDKDVVVAEGQGRKKKYCDSNCRKMEWYFSSKVKPVIHPFSGKSEMPDSPLNTMVTLTNALVSTVENDLINEGDVYQTVVDTIISVNQDVSDNQSESDEPWSLKSLIGKFEANDNKIESFVYIIEFTDSSIKVGKANDPEKRSHAISRASGKVIVRMETFKFPTQAEAFNVEFKTHKLLQESKIHGEWYSASFDDAVSAVAYANTVNVKRIDQGE